MKRKQAGTLPEKTGYTKYFEHDGALRAYANRMMWFGISAVLISFVLALLGFLCTRPAADRNPDCRERRGVGGQWCYDNATDAPGIHGRLGRIFGSRRATRGH
jgi:hypothetical protein